MVWRSQWRSLEQHVLWRGPASCTRGGLASAPVRMGGAGASGHALARIVHRVLSLLHRVVRFRLDHCHHVSAYGDNVGGGMHSMWMMHVAREQWDLANAFALQLCAQWLSSGPAGSQPVASDTRNHRMLLTCVSACCCDVSACARRWRGSHACSVHACRAVEWERARGRGEAEADRNSRCASVAQIFVPQSCCFCQKMSLFGKKMPPPLCWANFWGKSCARAEQGLVHPCNYPSAVEARVVAKVAAAKAVRTVGWRARGWWRVRESFGKSQAEI